MKDLRERLAQDVTKGILTQKYSDLIWEFYSSYIATGEKRGVSVEEVMYLFHWYCDLVEEQIAEPHEFEPYHHMIREPTDYYQFGMAVIGGLADKKRCTAHGLEQADIIEEQLARGDNVVFLANHQTECDPQALSILLEKTHRDLGKDTIWVAGERVLIDPMAVPFSMGRNLLCVYSKKYVDNPPEKASEKKSHNAKTMRVMFKMLEEGGKSIYVAPSGGRDRRNAEGEVILAPFDSQSIELFRMIAKRCKRPCHFYPMALATYHILPPPHSPEGETWERRYTEGGAIHLGFGPEIDIDNFPGSDEKDRKLRREALANHAWNLVNEIYTHLPKE